MNNQRVAKELVRLARELVSTRWKRYKGLRYGEKNGVWVVEHEDGSEFILSLDDSKSTGGRRHIEEANNEKAAKDYIDWIKRSKKF